MPRAEIRQHHLSIIHKLCRLALPRHSSAGWNLRRGASASPSRDSSFRWNDEEELLDRAAQEAVGKQLSVLSVVIGDGSNFVVAP
jgi:hypothetical protein